MRRRQVGGKEACAGPAKDPQQEASSALLSCREFPRQKGSGILQRAQETRPLQQRGRPVVALLRRSGQAWARSREAPHNLKKTPLEAAQTRHGKIPWGSKPWKSDSDLSGEGIRTCWTWHKRGFPPPSFSSSSPFFFKRAQELLRGNSFFSKKFPQLKTQKPV